MIELKSYLEGRFQAGTGSPATLVNPATEAPVATVSSEGLDLGAAMRFARDVGGPTLRSMTYAERGAVLKAMSKVLYEARESLIEASIVNSGTTRSDSKFDIDGATGTLAYYAGLGKQLGDVRHLRDGEPEQLTRSARFYGYHIRTPRRGVAVHINAFNFPAWGLFEKAAVALLSGVPVVSKPGTSTALLAYRCMEVLVEANVLPEGALSLLCGAAGDLLSHLQTQDVLAFTGSGKTGEHLRALSSVVGASVRINVEADSLNSAIVGPDVEPGSDTYQMFLRDAVKEITQKTGQKCTATRRIFVPESIVDRVQSDLAEELARIKVGDPSLDEVRMGPLSNAQQLRDVREGIALLKASGAKVVAGHIEECAAIGREGDKGYFIGPVLLRHDAPEDAGDVHRHEVFGPVSTLLPYGDSATLGHLVAMGEGALVNSVYSDDKKFLSEFLLDIAPVQGRVLVGTKKVADQATQPGMVLPSCVHGGPGRAGGGEELGGLRALDFYHQRTAFQGDRALLDKLL